MKTIIYKFTGLSLFFLLFTVNMLGQNYNVELCNTFDSNITRISIDTSSNWAIGLPTKTTLNGSFNSQNSIVTNLDSLYNNNDTSVFIASFYAPQYLGLFLPISIEFTHRFLTDTIHDFGEVEISYDNGNYWFDLLSDTLNAQSDNPPTKGNFHIYENTNDTLFDNLKISGNSGGWIHSKFYKNVVGQPDSAIILIKFTFNSDSIGRNEGWQIDDLCISEDYLSSVPEYDKSESLNIFPNPNNGTFTIEYPESQGGDLEIFDLKGILIKRSKLNLTQNNQFSPNLKPGIYFIKISNETSYAISKFIVK